MCKKMTWESTDVKSAAKIYMYKKMTSYKYIYNIILYV